MHHLLPLTEVTLLPSHDSNKVTSSQCYFKVSATTKYVTSVSVTQHSNYWLAEVPYSSVCLKPQEKIWLAIELITVTHKFSLEKFLEPMHNLKLNSP